MQYYLSAFLKKNKKNIEKSRKCVSFECGKIVFVLMPYLYLQRGRECRGGGFDGGGQFREHGEDAEEHGCGEDDGEERGFAHGSVPFKTEEKVFLKFCVQ